MKNFGKNIEDGLKKIGNQFDSCITDLGVIVDKEIKNVKTAYNNQKTTNMKTAEEIKAYKELLDSGAISLEEYEKKKKQLLES